MLLGIMLPVMTRACTIIIILSIIGMLNHCGIIGSVKTSFNEEQSSSKETSIIIIIIIIVVVVIVVVYNVNCGNIMVKS